nr:40S ribosomal protein S21 [Vulpes vulpes]
MTVVMTVIVVVVMVLPQSFWGLPWALQKGSAGQCLQHRSPPPRSSASNRIIGAKDHASIQMNVAEVDKVTGRFNGQFKTYAICGAIRRMGESDDSILRLAKADGIVSKNF